MHTALFLALKDPHNPRGHPLLAALLYAFCPAAARWWLAGAEAQERFDPVWRALADLAGGKTLKEALAGYGFESLLPDARQYVEQVEAFRRHHPGVSAPERLPTFGGGHLELSKRFGLQEAIGKLGGRWENFFTYVRAWAFLVADWEAAMRFVGAPDLRYRPVMLIASGVRRAVRFPAWAWLDRVGNGQRLVLGLLVAHREQEEPLFSLARVAGPQGDKPWLVRPEVWALDRDSGMAEPADPRLGAEDLTSVVTRLAELAKRGPYPPLAALGAPERCRACGFTAQCYADGLLSPLALEFA